MKVVNPENAEINAYAYVDADTTDSPVIVKAKNVSSMTETNVGEYSLNFATALASVNYTWAGSARMYTDSPTMAVVYEDFAITRLTTALAVRTSTAANNPRDLIFGVIITGA